MLSRVPVFSLLSMLIVTSLVLACSSSKKATPTVNRETVKGKWVLDNISYDGSVPLKLVLLDEGPEACLKGSIWDLPNNGYGSYTIPAGRSGCEAGEKKIIWSYRFEKGRTIFQYKRLQENVKAKNIEEGYRFSILSGNSSSLVLQSEVNFEGKPFYINYSFSRK